MEHTGSRNLFRYVLSHAVGNDPAVGGGGRRGVFHNFFFLQMLQAVAMFGMRNYQATDVTNQFDSGEYISSRIITSFAMVVVCGIYAWLMRFEDEKRIIYLLFCGVKLFEALSDVMEGIIHRKNRLDLASKSLFLRTVFLIIGFIGTLVAGFSLLTASLLAFLIAVLGFFLCSWLIARKFERFFISMNCRRVGKLLLQCLPLFLVAAAGAYITNAPKIAIDLNMDDQVQAQFSIIFMPAFVINLVRGFIFRPQLNMMAGYYASKEMKPFRKLIQVLTLLDIGLTLVAFGGTYFFGIPVLEWIYQVDIYEHKGVLLLVILCGSLCALSNLLCQALTVMRRQSSILLGYLIAAAVSAAISNPLVKYCGMLGAAILYSLSMVLLVFFLTFFYIRYVKKLENH